ncbi:MAG: HNH endonuclease [Phycisphaeraceae bacterium]|nr:HNH endonuclease [Phycisphaeraceae bacterium]
MTNHVLWRRLTETDFNAINGEASPHGRGGGAMHIALGVASRTFAIDQFLSAGGRHNVTVRTSAFPGHQPEAELHFRSNPNRRGGEWLIRDQFTHRHPAWTATAGFPTAFDPRDPPYVLVFRTGDLFHVRASSLLRLRRLGRAYLPPGLLTDSKGVATASDTMLRAFDVPAEPALDEFERRSREIPPEAFDPHDNADGRHRIIASVVRRLGQPAFRRRLIQAYDAKCAITRCDTVWVLEAAHITPYRGIRTNAVTNGLLLRADVHTLFDLALIAIDPAVMRVRVSSMLRTSSYQALDGSVPTLPQVSAAQPNPTALAEHYRSFTP